MQSLSDVVRKCWKQREGDEEDRSVWERESRREQEVFVKRSRALEKSLLKRSGLHSQRLPSVGVAFSTNPHCTLRVCVCVCVCAQVYVREGNLMKALRTW